MFAQAASFCVNAACAIFRAVSISGAVTSAVMQGVGGSMKNSNTDAPKLTREFVLTP
jgi:hypothetical protein